MILVTTGTNAPAFDRLLRAVEHFDNGESLVVQHGPSKLRPPGATCVDYLAFDQFVELVREARVVITHAGVGSILITLMNGKRPIVVPRLARFGEHVDDHQVGARPTAERDRRCQARRGSGRPRARTPGGRHRRAESLQPCNREHSSAILLTYPPHNRQRTLTKAGRPGGPETAPRPPTTVSHSPRDT